MILEFLGEKIEYPITFCMSHFVRHYVKDGTIKIKFVWPEDNDSDIFTKNRTEYTYDKHTSKFMIVNSAE